jgi:hypothetical protein
VIEELLILKNLFVLATAGIGYFLLTPLMWSFLKKSIISIPYVISHSDLKDHTIAFFHEMIDNGE